MSLSAGRKRMGAPRVSTATASTRGTGDSYYGASLRQQLLEIAQERVDLRLEVVIVGRYSQRSFNALRVVVQDGVHALLRRGVDPAQPELAHRVRGIAPFERHAHG